MQQQHYLVGTADVGGFTLCVYVQFATVIAQAVAFATLPVVCKSFSKSCCLVGPLSTVQNCTFVKNGAEHDGNTEMDGGGAAHQSTKTRTRAAEPKMQAGDVVVIDGINFRSDEIYDSIRPAVWFTLGFHFLNLFVCH